MDTFRGPADFIRHRIIKFYFHWSHSIPSQYKSSLDMAFPQDSLTIRLERNKYIDILPSLLRDQLAWEEDSNRSFDTVFLTPSDKLQSNFTKVSRTTVRDKEGANRDTIKSLTPTRAAQLGGERWPGRPRHGQRVKGGQHQHAAERLALHGREESERRHRGGAPRQATQNRLLQRRGDRRQLRHARVHLRVPLLLLSNKQFIQKKVPHHIGVP